MPTEKHAGKVSFWRGEASGRRRRGDSPASTGIFLVPSNCLRTAPLAAFSCRRPRTPQSVLAVRQLTVVTTPLSPGSPPARSGLQHPITSRSLTPRAHGPCYALVPTWRQRRRRVALHRYRWRARSCMRRRAGRARSRQRAWCSTPPDHGAGGRTSSSPQRHAHAQWSSCCWATACRAGPSSWARRSRCLMRGLRVCCRRRC